MTENGIRQNGVSEGSGSHKQGLHETYLGRWLTLFRVQSLPISAVVVSLGYLVAVETVILREILGLVTVAAVAHAGVNAQNDALDHPTDLENKEDDKPLISGEITVEQATFSSSVLIASSITIGLTFFSQSSPLLFAAVGASVLYNITSSSRWWSLFLFGAWGLLFSLFGYMVGGGLTFEGLFLSLLFGLMMTTYIFLGDILDMESDEESVHKKMGSEFVEPISGRVLYKPGDAINEQYVTFFFALWTVALIVKNTDYTGFDLGPVVITALMMFAAYKAVKMSCYVNPIDGMMKQDFLVYVITTAGALLVVFAPAVGVINITLISIGSVVWATVTMKIMYGRWLYFP